MHNVDHPAVRGGNDCGRFHHAGPVDRAPLSTETGNLYLLPEAHASDHTRLRKCTSCRVPPRDKRTLTAELYLPTFSESQNARKSSRQSLAAEIIEIGKEENRRTPRGNSDFNTGRDIPAGTPAAPPEAWCGHTISAIPHRKAGKGDDDTERRENFTSRRRIPANQDACEKSEENVQRSLSPRGRFGSNAPKQLQGVSTRRTIAAEEDACKENKEHGGGSRSRTHGTPEEKHESRTQFQHKEDCSRRRRHALRQS